MEIQGKIIQVLPEQTGQGKNGPWKKNRFVVETQSQYPKKVCFDVWGDKIDNMPIQEGNQVSVSFDVESREYNGNWYNDIKAWKVTSGQATNTAIPQQGPAQGNPLPPPSSGPVDTSSIPAGKAPDQAAEYEDDLPF